MDKLLIRGQLQTIKNNYALTQAGIALLISPDCPSSTTAAFCLQPSSSAFEIAPATILEAAS